MRPLLIVLTVVAVACGTAADPGTTAPGSGGVAATSTSVGQTPTTDGVAPTSTTQPTSASTTTAAPTTTTAPAQATTTTAPPGPIQVVPYFYVDEAGHPNRTGPFLIPVAREVEPTVAVARASLEQLFAGPTADERKSVPAISTMVPAGVELLGLSISGSVATVDLSAEFEALDDSAVVSQRAAQVVFTLARFDTVSKVLFHQEGQPVPIQIGSGKLVDRPVGVDDYLEFAAALSVESPVYGGAVGDPMRVVGFGAVFEAAFQYALTDADGLILEEGMAMTSNGVGWGDFDFTIDYDVDRPQLGALIVWAYSAKDGERIDIREYPVYLRP